METEQIRNFSIIAHIDHGKSTLADRFLELTGTVEKRKMREQVLDQMELERERGITIKMAPVRMVYHPEARSTNFEARNSFEFRNSNFGFAGSEFILNLIDTPGHIDFSYEVSRALKAVEGVILLVDASQGAQAQTFTVLQMAQELGLAIIPVINKIDLPTARVEETRQELVSLLACQGEEILLVSAKTGAGVPALLEAVVKRVPPPCGESAGTVACPLRRVASGEPRQGREASRALIFDFEYSSHQGVIVYARIFDGLIRRHDLLAFGVSGKKFEVMEVGVFRPEKTPVEALQAGEIGYLITGVKEPGQVRVGDTIINPRRPLPLFPGFLAPKPVVWASLFPANQNDFALLKQSLERLRLSDASLTFEEEAAAILGRGFRAGFLGLLHLEIVTERLRREFGLSLTVATPTVSYRLRSRQSGKEHSVYSPALFPEETKDFEIFEPWVRATIIIPSQYLGAVLKMAAEHEVEIAATDDFSSQRVRLTLDLPLRELMRRFFDDLKTISSGFASFSYQLTGERPAEIVRLDILLNNELVPPFSRLLARRRLPEEAEASVERLKKLLPRQLIAIRIQARALGRILASRSISALRKDVTGYLYGGDITRKMKLREKQKRGKKKMQLRTSVRVPPEVFLKMINPPR